MSRDLWKKGRVLTRGSGVSSVSEVVGGNTLQSEVSVGSDASLGLLPPSGPALRSHAPPSSPALRGHTPPLVVYDAHFKIVATGDRPEGNRGKVLSLHL